MKVYTVCLADYKVHAYLPLWYVRTDLSYSVISFIVGCHADMLNSPEDGGKQSGAVEFASDEATQVPGSLAAKPHSVISDEGTLVSAESLNAAYRALGNAALSVVHGDPGDDILL